MNRGRTIADIVVALLMPLLISTIGLVSLLLLWSINP